MTRSFRFRLTALYLALFSVLFVLFSILLYGGISKTVRARIDDSLAYEAETAAGIFLDEMDETKGDVQASANETVTAMKLHGDEIYVFEGGRVLASKKAAPDTAPHTSAFREVAAVGRKFRIVVAASLRPVADTTRAAREVILIALPLVLALAGIGGYLLAGRTLRPLSSMAGQARRITDASLHTRIEIGRAAEEMETLVAAFNELLSRLDRSFDGMRRFVADASHELRTPISIIRGEADVALSTGRTPAEYRAVLSVILDESRRLSRLVDDLLNLARADAGRVRLQVRNFYLNELLGDCCRSVQALAAARSLTIECRPSDDLEYSGDEDLLRRLVMNLLDNAIRYTPPGGRISASLEPNGASVRLHISDSGIGIAPEDAPRVFERFYRAGEARSRQDGGFGLGLAIVKWIAESHRGTVECASRPGEGSTFTVTLPWTSGADDRILSSALSPRIS
ncbi:MAG TPA: ATP-binding protein [Verrucomicrobiae bacterium]|nr:ATP-binding protein [Verrucomicrobiae bacterium]